MARNNPKQKLIVLGKRIIMAEEGKEFLKMHNYRKEYRRYKRCCSDRYPLGSYFRKINSKGDKFGKVFFISTDS